MWYSVYSEMNTLAHKGRTGKHDGIITTKEQTQVWKYMKYRVASSIFFVLACYIVSMDYFLNIKQSIHNFVVFFTDQFSCQNVCNLAHKGTSYIKHSGLKINSKIIVLFYSRQQLLWEILKKYIYIISVIAILLYYLPMWSSTSLFRIIQ